MSELIANYSGAGMIVSTGYHQGTTANYRKLEDEFKREVLDNERFAWYIDYYTEDPRQFHVRLLSMDPEIRITNEDKSHRDPGDLENTMWTSTEVAEWFFDTDTIEAHRRVMGVATDPVTRVIPDVLAGSFQYVFKFATNDSVERRLTLRALHGDIDGDSEGVWDRYVVDGIRGALEPFLNDFSRLVGIEVHAL